jgi:hypothetical protein
MIKKSKQKLTLDIPARYQIKVPGALDERGSVWDGDMTISVESTDEGSSVTTLTGTLDQAALHGLLWRLYALGLPLISVNCLDSS